MDKRNGINGEYDRYHYKKEENLTFERRVELFVKAEKMRQELIEKAKNIKESMKPLE